MRSNRALKRPFNFSAQLIKSSFAAALILITLSLIGDGAVAQESEVSADNAVVPNTSARHTTNDGKVSLPKDGGKNKVRTNKSRDVHLPGLQGFKGMADSKDLRAMLRQMITSQTITMHQTMMMVENGAATGFIGGMQTVSNLMNNMVQSSDLELSLKRAQDPKGMKALAFANSIFKGMKKQTKNKEAWPLGLWFASGDNPKKALEAGQMADDFDPNENGGASVGDALAIVEDSEASPSASGSEVASGAELDTEKEIKLVDKLLGNNGAVAPSPKSAAYAKKYLGNIVYKFEQSAGPSSQTRTVFEPAEEVKTKKGATGTTEQDKQVRGFELRRWEIQKDVWNATYDLLGKYCEFKQNNQNRRANIFEKRTPASVVTKDLLEKASSQGIRMTINLIDQLFKVFVGVNAAAPSDPTGLKCDFSGKTAESTMPDEFKPQEGAKIQNCENDPKNCDRNKWLFLITQIIAEDRTINEFRETHEALINGALAEHPAFLVSVQEFVCTSLMADRRGGNDLSLCDPGIWLDMRAESNRQRWVNKIGDFSEWAQNVGGASNFNFKGQNVASMGVDDGTMVSAAAE